MTPSKKKKLTFLCFVRAPASFFTFGKVNPGPPSLLSAPGSPQTDIFWGRGEGFKSQPWLMKAWSGRSQWKDAWVVASSSRVGSEGGSGGDRSGPSCTRADVPRRAIPVNPTNGHTSPLVLALWSKCWSCFLAEFRPSSLIQGSVGETKFGQVWPDQVRDNQYSQCFCEGVAGQRPVTLHMKVC